MGKIERAKQALQALTNFQMTYFQDLEEDRKDVEEIKELLRLYGMM